VSAMPLGPGRIPQGPPSLPLADRGYQGFPGSHLVGNPVNKFYSSSYAELSPCEELTREPDWDS
jgi:hypothetical protein